MRDAIATFERSLATPNSRFDRYLRGDTNALSADEREGYALFRSYGCTNCHRGENIGGTMFATLGVIEDYFADRGHATHADLGRFNVTARDGDRYRFKVPSLRLVVLTAPYFHDGTAATLDDAITVMARYQLGREIPARDRALIIRFLESLPGEYAGAALASRN